jgi:hypothetical protein
VEHRGDTLVSWGNLREKYSNSITSEQVVAQIEVNHVEVLSLEITATGDPLSSFVVNARLHPAGSFIEMYSSTVDYSAPSGLIIGSSCSLPSLSGTGWLILDTRGLDVIQIEAGSSGTTTLSILAIGS